MAASYFVYPLVVIIVVGRKVASILGRMSGLVVMMMGRSGSGKVIPQIGRHVASAHSLSSGNVIPDVRGWINSTNALQLSPLSPLRSRVVEFSNSCTQVITGFTAIYTQKISGEKDIFKIELQF